MYSIEKIIHKRSILAKLQALTMPNFGNEYKKDQHYSDRVMSMFDIIYVSEKSQDKVIKILDEDKKHLN